MLCFIRTYKKIRSLLLHIKNMLTAMGKRTTANEETCRSTSV